MKQKSGDGETNWNEPRRKFIERSQSSEFELKN